MKKLYLLTLIAMCVSTVLWGISIFDIQYTNNPGIDNTFPSSYIGRNVTIDGVVTATGYRGNGFILSEPNGGPYRAILISDNAIGVHQGDYLSVSGTVSETFGMTCIENVSQVRIMDRNRALPLPYILGTGQISSAEESEAFECVLVKVQNATISSSRANRNKFNVTDGSGQCSVMVNNFASNLRTNFSIGTHFSSITGIVLFAYSEYALNVVNASGISIASPVYNQNRSWGRIKSIYR